MSETPADVNLATLLDQARLPDGSGPPVDHALLERVVRKDPELDPNTTASVFRMIAAYREWDRAYLDLVMKNKKSG